MEETLRKLAEYFERRVSESRRLKHLADRRPNKEPREYWAGKEQAFYEAWQTVEKKIKED